MRFHRLSLALSSSPFRVKKLRNPRCPEPTDRSVNTDDTSVRAKYHRESKSEREREREKERNEPGGRCRRDESVVAGICRIILGIKASRIGETRWHYCLYTYTREREKEREREKIPATTRSLRYKQIDHLSNGSSLARVLQSRWEQLSLSLSPRRWRVRFYIERVSTICTLLWLSL